jgi:hypothetical protein
MSEDEALKTGLAALAELTKELREQKLKESGIPPWVSVLVTIMVPTIGLILWFGKLDSRMQNLDQASTTAHRRLDASDLVIRENASKTSRRLRVIERKLDLPDGE